MQDVQGAMSAECADLQSLRKRCSVFEGPNIPMGKVEKRSPSNRQGIRLPSAAVPQKDGGAETRWLDS